MVPKRALKILQKPDGLPKVVKVTDRYVILRKPFGWLCSGSDEDLRKGLSPPLGAGSIGLHSQDDLKRWIALERDAPMIHWFLQIAFPHEAFFFDPACNFGLCSRLDIGPSGLLVVAKSAEGRSEYQQASNGGLIQKRYLAITAAAPLAPVVVTANFRDRTTVLRSETRASGRSLIGVEMIGGRRHQIRQDLASLGAPLLGDVGYNGQEHWSIHLHCAELVVSLPGHRFSVSCKPPKLFETSLGCSFSNHPEMSYREMGYGLSVIGLAKNAEELPADFSVDSFLERLFKCSKPFSESQLMEWQGAGMPGPYRWSVTNEIVSPLLDYLPPHLASAACSKPKLAPTAKSRAVALARIGLSRCTPLREAEPILDKITYLLARAATEHYDIDTS